MATVNDKNKGDARWQAWGQNLLDLLIRIFLDTNDNDIPNREIVLCILGNNFLYFLDRTADLAPLF